MDPLYDELQFAIRTARRIGALVRTDVQVTATLKGDGTPQTRLDVAGNALFHQEVRERWPGDLALEAASTLRVGGRTAAETHDNTNRG